MYILYSAPIANNNDLGWREVKMVFLLLFSMCAIVCLVLVLVGYVKAQSWDSRSRLINADWMSPAEKFSLIARWGA